MSLCFPSISVRKNVSFITIPRITKKKWLIQLKMGGVSRGFIYVRIPSLVRKKVLKHLRNVKNKVYVRFVCTV